MKKNLISLLITIFIGLVIYYFTLPVFNIHSLGFWVYLVTLLIVFYIALLCLSINLKGKVIRNEKVLGGVMTSIFIIILGIILVNFVLSPVFHSKSYSNRITVNEDSEFTKDVEWELILSAHQTMLFVVKQ